MRKIYIYLHNRKIGTLAVNFNIAPKNCFIRFNFDEPGCNIRLSLLSRRCALFKILAHKFYNFTVVTKERQIPSSGAESPAATRLYCTSTAYRAAKYYKLTRCEDAATLWMLLRVTPPYIRRIPARIAL